MLQGPSKGALLSIYHSITRKLYERNNIARLLLCSYVAGQSNAMAYGEGLPLPDREMRLIPELNN